MKTPLLILLGMAIAGMSSSVWLNHQLYSGRLMPVHQLADSVKGDPEAEGLVVSLMRREGIINE